MTSCLESWSDMDETAVDRVSQEIFRCVKKDHLIKAKFITKSMTKDDRKRAVTKTSDGKAPLFEACKQGLVHFVNYFLDDCGADVEQRGVYEVAEDHTRHKVTPLWCSAVSNRIEVLKALLKHGAEVDAMSDTRSTPVRSACYMTNIETVKLLVEHGADIHQPNVNGGTCLINSVQSVELCRFLLEQGVRVDAQDNSRNSAMHYAIREERLETVKLLLANNADVAAKNESGDDAFRTASLRGYPSVLNLLMQHSQPDIQRQIESHELMGTNFVDEKNDIPKAIQEWRKALLMRQSNNLMLSPCDIKAPLPAYRNHVEAITLEQLSGFESSSDRVYIQSLLVRERVLGPDHKDTVFGLMYRGAVYADSHSYQRCVDLWKYAFHMRHSVLERLSHEGMYTLQALCKLFLEIDEEFEGGFTSETVRYEDVMSVFETLSVEVEAKVSSFETSAPEDGSTENPEEDLQTLVFLLLHLMHLLDHIATEPVEAMAFKHRVHHLLKKRVRLMDGRSLLHLAMDPKTALVGGDFYSTFPNEHVIHLLLACGADVNAADDMQDTPLHCCSKMAEDKNLHADEKAKVAMIAETLIAKGAHVDARNANGEMASAGLCCVVQALHSRLMHHVSLKCLAARTIRNNDITYEGEVPETLHSFIHMH